MTSKVYMNLLALFIILSRLYIWFKSKYISVTPILAGPFKTTSILYTQAYILIVCPLTLFSGTVVPTSSLIGRCPINIDSNPHLFPLQLVETDCQRLDELPLGMRGARNQQLCDTSSKRTEQGHPTKCLIANLGAYGPLIMT